VRAAVECENQLTAVERLWEYISQLPSEAPHALPADDKLPVTVWPSSGEVSLHKVRDSNHCVQPPCVEIQQKERGGIRTELHLTVFVKRGTRMPCLRAREGAKTH